MQSGKSNLHGVIFGLVLSYFAAYQQFKLPVVLPELLNRYGYDLTLAGGFMSIYAVAGLLISIWLGKSIQKHGAGQLIQAAMALFAAGSLLALWMPEQGMVVLFGRGLEGIAFAVLAIAGPVLAHRNASEKSLPIIIGLTATWIPMGQLSATLLAPAALSTYGWQSLWVVAIAGAMLIAVWSAYLYRRRPSLIGQASSPADRDRKNEVKDAAGIELSSKQRLALVLGGAVFMLWSCQYFAFMTWLPEYLVDQFDLNLSAALYGYLVPVVFVALTCVVTGTLLRLGVALRLLLAIGLFAQLAVWWLLPYIGSGPLGIFSLVIYGTGGGIVPTCLFALPSVIVGQGVSMPRAFAIVMTGRNLGVLVGPILLAQAIKWAGGWSLAAPVFGSLTTLGWILALILTYRFKFAGFESTRRIKPNTA